MHEGLAGVAHPSRAAGMQAYMKSSMPYRGLKTADLRLICRQVFDAYPLDGFDEWQDTVLDLWRTAEYREDRYAAIELTGHRRYQEHQTPAAVPLYEEIVTAGAWWDYVDPVAIKRLGPMLRAHREAMTPSVRAWARDPHLWKRRAAIICQAGAKTETDVDLLRECIEANLGDRDFFIRKGIGWALREHGKVDPDQVGRYVAALGDRLSGLSRREALKYVQAAPS